MDGDHKDSRRAALEGGSLRVGESPARAASLRGASPEVIGDLLGLLTHDLRNPLAALSSNVSFLNMIGKDMSEEAREAVTDLMLSVEGMVRIIDSIELVGHELVGRVVPAPGVITIAAALRRVRAEAERGAASHGHEIKFDVGADEHAAFVAAEQQFAQALSALLHNGLTVAPPRSTITLRAFSTPNEVCFRMEDGGPTLEGEMATAAVSAEHISRVKSQRAARYSRGLGLYAVARSAYLAGVELRIGERQEGSALELAARRAQ